MDKSTLDFYVKNYPFRALTNTDGTASGQVLTCPARLAFAHLSKPKQKDNGKSVYQASLLFPVGVNIDALRTIVGACAAESFGPNWMAEMKAGRIRNPIKKQDANAERYDGFEVGGFYVDVQRSTEADAPAFVNDKVQPISADEFKSGYWVIARLRPYAYNTPGNKGVSFGVQSFQLLARDEEFKGGSSVDEFAPVAHPSTLNGASAGGAVASANDGWGDM